MKALVRELGDCHVYYECFDITNDEMFGNYVNTWDKRLSSKRDINPGNIDAFLDWADSLGE